MITDQYNNAVVEAALDFVRNVEGHNVAGSGEMPLACDVSYLILEQAIKQWVSWQCREVFSEGPQIDTTSIPIKAVVFDALRDCVMAHEATFIDWDRLNEHSPDHDPNYKPQFPDVVKRANEALTFLRPI